LFCQVVEQQKNHRQHTAENMARAADHYYTAAVVGRRLTLMHDGPDNTVDDRLMTAAQVFFL
jgi:hypothetical protein